MNVANGLYILVRLCVYLLTFQWVLAANCIDQLIYVWSVYTEFIDCGKQSDSNL